MSSPPLRPTQEASHRLRWAALGFAVLGLPLSLALTAVVLRASLARQSELALETGRTAAAGLEHELALRENAVEALVATAEQILDGRLETTLDVVDRLEPVPDRGGYTMGVPSGVLATEIGSLMGEGPLPPPGSAAAREMAMAVSLAPGFQVFRRQEADIPWVYYVSRRGFLYIHPRAPDGQFLWSHELLDRYAPSPGGAVLRVDGKRMGWSAIYPDMGGKGLMTTLSKLVVHRGELMGDVSVDVAVSTLLGHLDRAVPPDSTMLLLAADGADMLQRGARPGRIDPRTAPREQAFQLDGAEISLFPVESTGWWVAVETPNRARYLRALRDSAVYGLMSAFVLVSATLLVLLAKAQRSLAILSVRDPLTGVYNRRHFDDMAKCEVARARRVGLKLGLAIIDVDHFKKYNDRYGHQAGDRVLRDVASGLRDSLQRATDELFRIGGEEFAVLCYVERPEQLTMLADKLCAAIRKLELVHLDSPSGYVTISVGATVVDATHGFEFEAGHRQADAALYRAKAAGRDRSDLG